MLHATGQDALHGNRVLIVPCRTARIRVARMPRQGDDAASKVVGNEFFTDAGEGHRVQILLVTHLYAAKVEPHDGRIVTRCFLCIAAAPFPLPRQTVEGIILMTKHIATSLQLLQALQEMQALRLGR